MSTIEYTERAGHTVGRVVPDSTTHKPFTVYSVSAMEAAEMRFNQNGEIVFKTSLVEKVTKGK